MLALDSLLSSTLTSIEEESFEESSLGQVDTAAMPFSKLSMDRFPNFGKPSETGCQMRRPLEVPTDNDGLPCDRISALEEAAAQLSKLQTSDAPEFWNAVVSAEQCTSVSEPSVLSAAGSHSSTASAARVYGNVHGPSQTSVRRSNEGLPVVLDR
jgi:hypothetical protein